VKALTRLALRRPKLMLGLWVVAIALLSAPGATVRERLAQTTLRLPGTESSRAAALEDRHFPKDSVVPVLLQGPPAAVEAQGRALVRSMRRKPGVRALSPWDGGSGANALRKSPGTALVVIQRAPRPGEIFYEVAPRVEREVSRVVHAPVEAHVTGAASIGRALNDASLEAAKKAEMIAVPVLIVVLLLVFRSPLAALIPGVVGGTTVAAAFGGIALIASVTSIDAISTSLASMMGLALGVDYSLLMVSRFREELREGASPQAAASTAAASAGRTVVFAGVVLIVAMIVALALSPGTILVSGAAGIVTAAVLSVATAVTAIPSALVLLGHRIDRWQFGRRGDRGGRDPGRTATAVARRPLVAAVALLALMLLLAAPTLGFETGPSNVGLLSPKSKTRKDFEALNTQMGPGWTNPFSVVMVSPRGAITRRDRLARIARFERTIARDANVETVIGPGELDRAARRLRRFPRTLGRANAQLASGRRGLGRLEAGLGRADAGVVSLRSGIGRAAAGAQRVAAGAGDARAGATRLAGGLGRAGAGGHKLADGLTLAQRGSDRFGAGLAKLHSGSRSLARALASLPPRIDPAIAGADRLAGELRNGADGLARLRQPAQVTESQLDQAAHDLQAMSVGKADPRYASALRAVLTAQGAVSGRDPRDGSPVADGYNGLDAELAAASGGLRDGAAGAARLAGGSRKLQDGLTRLAAGGGRLASGAERLQGGYARLDSGIGRLAGAGQTLGGGLDRLGQGGAALRDGLGSLASGAGRLRGGLDGGYTRAQPLADGLSRAKDSTGRFRERLAAMRGGGLAQLNQRSPKLFDSGYFVLAAVDGANPRERSRAAEGVSIDDGGQAARLLVIPRSGPNDPATAALEQKLSREAAGLGAATGTETAVGGIGAELADYDRVTAERLPILILALALVTYLVMIPVLRALLLPLIAVVLNLLTVAAAFGVLALLFGGDTPVLGGPGFMDVVAVTGIFTVIFGLSIDYEVFLLTRMREGWDRYRDTDDAVKYGLRRTARVITGAAAIMAAVFLANSFSDFTSVRQFGVGLTVAVVLDAVVVRLMLLPAVMRLCGRWTWWLPAWLDRVLPELDVDGATRRDRAARAGDADPAFA
jgi:putative drug exporter of the RND superfamily